MKGKRIVVTGGAGFIGSNLAWSLCDENDVVVVDNLATGKMDNIVSIVDSGKIRFVEGSVTDLQLMKRILADVDVVFHEAAIPSVPRSVADPLSTNEAGVTGTLTSLLAARDCGVKRFVFASSSSVYGDTPTLPKCESMHTNPISPYALTKVTSESYCKLFADLYGLSTISLRYFNVYGPRQDSNSQYAAVVPRFITQALASEDLTVYGDGLQTRDFTYVQDAVRANIRAAESGSQGSFNIASGRQTTVQDLALHVIDITKSKSGLRRAEARPGDIVHSVADVSRAERAVGYSPSYTIYQGLKETVAWFSKRRG